MTLGTFPNYSIDQTSPYFLDLICKFPLAASSFSVRRLSSLPLLFQIGAKASFGLFGDDRGRKCLRGSRVSPFLEISQDLAMGNLVLGPYKLLFLSFRRRCNFTDQQKIRKF